MPINMGLGNIGGPQVVHKRKFRWTFEVNRPKAYGGNVPSSYVKLAARPNISIEETEINFLNGKVFIPGKGTWETITVTYYDVSTGGAGLDNTGLWSWLANVYNFMNPTMLTQNSRRECYAGEGICTLYDGCGNRLEQWKLFDAWPQAVNFGELDYSSSEEVTIEVTVRYANVEYKNYCGPQPTVTCCGCTAPTYSGDSANVSANSGQSAEAVI
jgi:hypothetical protein